MARMSPDLQTLNPPMEIPRGADYLFRGIAAVASVGMALAFLLYGTFGEAITEGLDRACAEAQFEAGQKQAQLGNHESALLFYRNAMAGHFSDPDRQMLCGRAIGDLLYRLQRYDEAIAAYQALPPEAFASSGAYTGYVSSLYHSGDLKAARDQGEHWLKLALVEQNTEQIVWARSILMRIAETEGREGEALAHGAEILRLNPAADAALVTARLLQRRGEHAEAVARLDAFLAASGNQKLLSEARRLRAQIAP
jgi:tetratricopeptide (TPR) repeat protein